MGEIGMGFEGWIHGRAYNAKTEMLPRARFLPFLPPLQDTVPLCLREKVARSAG